VRTTRSCQETELRPRFHAVRRAFSSHEGCGHSELMRGLWLSEATDDQDSLQSLGPTNLHLTSTFHKPSPRLARLPSDLEQKVKDLQRDLQFLLQQAAGPRVSNVEFCVQSACKVLNHLVIAVHNEDAGARHGPLEAELEIPHWSSDEQPEESGQPLPRSQQSPDASIPLGRGRSFESARDTVWISTEPVPEEDGGEDAEASFPSEEADGALPKSPGRATIEAIQMRTGPTMDTMHTEWLNEASAEVGSRRRSFMLRRGSTTCTDIEMPTSSNRCYIHPEKSFRLGWDFCSMMLILCLSVLIPLEVCFFWESEEPVVLRVFAEVLDVFFMVDIILNFFTAYHEGHGISGRLVTDFRGIAKRYAKGWLLIDIVASFPWLRVMELVGSSGDQASNRADAMGMLKVLRYAKVARMVKVLRVLKLGSLIQIVEEKMVAVQSMTVAFQVLKMSVVMIIISHNVACGWYAVAIFTEEPRTWLHAQGLDGAHELRQYIASFYFAITTGTTVGYGDITPVNTIEQAVTVFVLVLSVAYIGQFLARVSQIFSSLRQIEAQTSQAKRDAMLFMKKRGVPRELQFKVLRYIEHVFETDAVTALDEKVMGLLSDSLKNQLAFSVTGHVLRQFPLFEDAEDTFLTEICQVCRTQRAGIGDTVVTEEQVAHEMFWVVRGEAAVLRQNRQVGGLRTGDWFGELSLFFPGAVRKATVRCETNCEFLVLHHDHFLKAIEEFPKVKKQYHKILADVRTGKPVWSTSSSTSRVLGTGALKMVAGPASGD